MVIVSGCSKVSACHLMVLAGHCLGPGLRRIEWMDLWTLDTSKGEGEGEVRKGEERGGWDATLSGILLYWTPRGAFKINFNHTYLVVYVRRCK